MSKNVSIIKILKAHSTRKWREREAEAELLAERNLTRSHEFHHQT